MNYEIVTNASQEKVIKKTDFDGTVWWIPTDPANSDYQAYLAYVANGDTLPSNSSIPQAGE
jgi:hypothetical protein